VLTLAALATAMEASTLIAAAKRGACRKRC
jgi:hypothetical protein